ncbi:MAG: hypothetical protein IKZ43_01330 [Acidaminococcaceae bacterium]|nr:hypothetical protein [Acidaminococcaceae bacterium]
MKRIPKTFIDKVAAHTLTRYCWRDLDVVENYHAGEPKPCNPVFYDAVYKAMSKRISDWLPRYIKEMTYQNSCCATASIADKEVDATATWYFRQYGEWDSPKKVRDHYKGNITEFLLRGEFLKACRDGTLLDDITMCNLNHDIHNRMYTLLRRNVIRII